MEAADLTDIKLPGVNHLGIVVKSTDQTAKFFSKMLGLKPWDIFDYEATREMLISGEPFTLRIGTAKIGALSIELLEPVAGDSIWAQFLKSNGEGLHHVAVPVPNWEEMVAIFQKRGAELIAGSEAAKQFAGKRWAYFNIASGGLILELMEEYEL